LAGTSRIQYPPNVRIIRLMCSGSVDPTYVLKPLLEGADGVLIGGCHPGDCHYQSGNYKARRRVVALKEILRAAGIDEERVWLRWVSASEGRRFAEIVAEMTAFLKEKGPNPLGRQWLAGDAGMNHEAEFRAQREDHVMAVASLSGDEK